MIKVSPKYSKIFNLVSTPTPTPDYLSAVPVHKGRHGTLTQLSHSQGTNLPYSSSFLNKYIMIYIHY